MGNHNFGQFKSYLTVTLGNRTGLDTYLPVWINGAYMRLCSINKFPVGRTLRNMTLPELDTFVNDATIDGQAYISRPSNCLHIYTVWDITNDRKLSERMREWYVEQTGRATTTGKPSFWIPGIYPRRTYLHPTPDGAYNMRTYFRRRPPRMVDDAEVTELGEEWDEAILQLAASDAHMWLRDFDVADTWKKEFVMTVGLLIGMTDKEARDFKDYMRVDPSYNDFGY